MIRPAKKSEIPQIKKLVDSFEEMDLIEETFSVEYYVKELEENHAL